MCKLLPQDARLTPYIDYYWLVEAQDTLICSQPAIHDFPSLAPELILGLQGCFSCDYRRQRHLVCESVLLGYIDGGLKVYPAGVERMVIVKFKNRGLAAVRPFLGQRIEALRPYPVIPAQTLFGPAFARFERHLSHLLGRGDEATVGAALDQWFGERLDARKPGMLLDLSTLLTPTTTLRDLLRLTHTSPSTLLRHFRHDAGLTPKQYLMRDRFRHLLAELLRTTTPDWFDLVVRYGYHDQNHLIKEVKRFTGFSPTRLLALPQIADHRPA